MYIQNVNLDVNAQPDTNAKPCLRLSQNENGRVLMIRIIGVDIPGGSTANFAGLKPDGNVYSKPGTVDGNVVSIEEDIQMTAVSGSWNAKITIINDGNTICTARIRVVVDASVVPGGAIPSDSQLDGIVAECQAYAESAKSAAYGSPLTASTAADMIDQDRVYVYTGSESGYTSGHWYYWDGTAWTDGGVYNSVAVDTDTTLSISGKAADAKKTGDEITELKSGLSELQTATAEDVGKALKAKTVADGKVTEWEFGSVNDNRVDGIAKQLSGNASILWEWEGGSWSNMAENPPTTKSGTAGVTTFLRIRSSFEITAKEKVTFKTLTGYKCIYSVYKDGTRIEYESSTYKAVDKIYTGAGTYTFYVNLAKSSDMAITPHEANSGLAVLADNAVVNLYDAIAQAEETAETAQDSAKEIFEKQFPGNPMIYWEWLIGGYSNLANDPPVNYGTSNTRTRLKVDVSVKEKLTLTCKTGYKYCYSIYKDGVRQEYSASWKQTTTMEFAYGEGQYTVYLTLGKLTDEEITVSESEDTITLLADDAVADINGTLTQATSLIAKKNLFDRNGANSLRGYYNASNAWTNAGGLGQTDFIPVKQGVQYTSAVTSMFVNWYDESKAFISSTPSKTFSAQGYVIPVEGAAFAKFGIIVASQQDFYVYSNEDTPVDIPLDSVPYGLYNQYKGKKGVAFGTSLTYRAKSSGGYLEYLPVMAEMDFDNQGLGNSTILEHEQHTDMMGMITGYASYADKDVVLIEGFVNDWYDNSDKLGTWKDAGTLESATVCGRIRYALNYIMSQVPYATIIMVLDPYGQSYNGSAGCASTVVKSGLTQMEYYEEIAKLAMSMGIPVVKGYAISGMNENTPDYYIDIIHPSPLGAKQFADTVWGAMKAIPVKCHS